MSAADLRLQIVVYDNTTTQLARTLRGAAAAIVHARAQEHVTVGSVECAIGDSSATPILDDQSLAMLNTMLADAGTTATYEHFGANLGSGGGSNRLMESSQAELVWILNPDTYPSPGALVHLLDAVGPDDVAAADGRQIPIEHPKSFDPTSGDTAWVSGACMLLRRAAATQVDGFDAHFFPMYCDDVDLSWRLRLAGWRVVHAPLAAVFHDKRLDESGRPDASDFEHGSGVLARLFLAHRYDRPDVVDATLDWAETSDLEAHRNAVATYRERLAVGDVPAALPGASGVADLDSDFYGPARFAY